MEERVSRHRHTDSRSWGSTRSYDRADSDVFRPSPQLLDRLHFRGIPELCYGESLQREEIKDEKLFSGCPGKNQSLP